MNGLRQSIGRAFAAALLVLFGVADAAAQRATLGEWSPVIDTKNVMIHACVLPDGRLLFWSRREAGEGLDPHQCTPRIWDPKTGAITTTPQPGYNLFCAGQAFLPDGRLFVAGGHLSDSHGSPRASIYDPAANTWTGVPDMKGGRWYPTVVSLPDGGVLVSFGSDENGVLNDSQQVWKDEAWREIVNFNAPPLYPRMHVVRDGSVFMTGPLPLTQFLNTTAGGGWTFLVPGDFAKSSRANGERQYAPSVLYDDGKVVYMGGGLGDNGAPTNAVEIVNLNGSDRSWKPAKPMNFGRRQHNATLLPDGTVLVTGGTQGAGFNNLTPGQPLRSAELWDPKTGDWKKLAKASVDRCYHSIAVLLPDATVLSAGGGEYRPTAVDQENPPQDTHRDAQVFSPPYLFKSDGSPADRPDVTSTPADVAYGQTFTVGTSAPADVDRVSWVRLSAVTHSFNSNQRINVLPFTVDGGGLKVTAPPDGNACPPGHYMLFVINKNGVPSVSRTIRIHP